jgi:uncharacterized protein RhaS with RHS repeats
MQARYYDPVIGRFYSNDPIGFRDVHSFNRYAYANNNLYKYTDPSGKSAEESFTQSFTEWSEGWLDLQTSVTNSATGAKNGAQQLGIATINSASDTVTAATNLDNLRSASNTMASIVAGATLLGQAEIAAPAALISTGLGYAAVQVDNPVHGVVVEAVVNFTAKPIGIISKGAATKVEGKIKNLIGFTGQVLEGEYKNLIKNGNW